MDDLENEDRGLQPIGSLTSGILNSLSTTVSETAKSQKPPPSFATIGSRQAVATRSSSIGQRHGATVFELLRNADPMRTGVDPEQIDRALDLLPPCVMRCLEVRTNTISDPNYGFMGTVKTFTPICTLASERESDLHRSIAALELVNDRAPEKMIVFELGRLRAMTKAKAEDQDSVEFLLRCYSDDMREYPADVVREACRKWARTEKFFPAWCELKDLLDGFVTKRRRLLAAVKRIRIAAPDDQP